MKVYEFDAIIKKHDKIDAAFIEFPFDVEKEFETKGQVKVRVLFDTYEYRGSLAKMGHHCHCLGITQQIRKAIGKNPGDTVHVTLKKDVEVREVEIPDDFNENLYRNPEAKKFFESLSYTNRKNYTRWITDAKKAETRNRRVQEAICLLLKGKKI